MYVYPKIADVRKALLSKEDGRARENGMKNLIKECDYVVGYFRDGYVPYFDRDKKVQTGDEDVWYRNATDDRVEMTLDEEMDAILECLSWTKKTHGFEDKSTYGKLRWVTMEEIETKMKDRRNGFVRSRRIRVGTTKYASTTRDALRQSSCPFTDAKKVNSLRFIRVSRQS